VQRLIGIGQAMKGNPLLGGATFMLLLLIVVAVLAPWVAPYGPLAIDGEAFLAPPDASHLFGTDSLGRDILSRVIYGTRISLRVAGGAVALAMAAGCAAGLLAGYFGGWVDMALSRVMDVMFAVPEVLLALVVMAVLGVGFGQITLAIAIVYAPIFARVSRAAVIASAAQPYVEAARTLGLGHTRIMLRHVLPGATAPIIVQATLSLAFAILAEAALSFLGLSGEADVPSWGAMLQDGKGVMEHAWWAAVFPGMAITLTVLSLNVVGDALRDALDPQRITAS
jgi:peptide/nickel transport system permease protein